MKQKIIIILKGLFLAIGMNANCGIHQRLSPEEFRSKQKEFLVEKAQLTEDEANLFFPVYFEFQDQMRALNNQQWTLLRKGDNTTLPESEYSLILDQLRLVKDQKQELEKKYEQKFRKVLSAKKLYLIQRSEVRFHREIIRGVRGKMDGKQGGRRGGRRAR